MPSMPGIGVMHAIMAGCHSANDPTSTTATSDFMTRDPRTITRQT
jgi:hypothetical protein